jgi:ABC-type sugar transport system substrate-binding protein
VPTMVSTLRSNPSYKYAFFTVGQYAEGIVPALSAAGLSGIKVGGRGMDSGALTELQQGAEAAWTADSYFVVGYGIVDVALRALTNSKGLDGDAVIPFQLVTPANAKGVANPYNAPADALQQYLKLWGVSK